MKRDFLKSYNKKKKNSVSRYYDFSLMVWLCWTCKNFNSIIHHPIVKVDLLSCNHLLRVLLNKYTTRGYCLSLAVLHRSLLPSIELPKANVCLDKTEMEMVFFS